MSFLYGIVASLVEKLLSKFAVWAWKTIQSNAKVSKAKERIDIEKDRLKKAIDEAYDGTPLTKEQADEIIDAGRALSSKY